MWAVQARKAMPMRGAKGAGDVGGAEWVGVLPWEPLPI